MNDFKATPECWEWQEKWASKEVPDEDSSCFLELRSRIEQLEAQASNYPAIPDTSTPPPAPTDEELREMWDRSLGIEHALRATYILGVAHGQSSSREVAEPAPVAGGLVARVAYAITGGMDEPITGCKLFTKTAGGSMVKYSALAIGKWFVAYAETEEDADTSNLRVQKLLYYAQGHYLARKGVPLFDEAIQAWSHGPVVPEVYHVFKRFGSNPVKLDKSDDFNFSDIDEETTQFLLEVWSAYAPYSTWALRNMTHKEQPWKNTFNGSLNVPISIEEIGKYFASV